MSRWCDTKQSWALNCFVNMVIDGRSKMVSQKRSRFEWKSSFSLLKGTFCQKLFQEPFVVYVTVNGIIYKVNFFET